MYDTPKVSKRYERFFDFGAAADETISIKGPKGATGRLWDYGVYGVTEVMNGTTITPKIAIGTTSDPDAYGDEINLNAVADNDCKSVRSQYLESEAGFAALMIQRELPADTEIYMTLTGATGAPTGQGTAYCDIDWSISA
jgi:hypothetical protein